MVLATLEVGQVTLLEATLSFLGVGIPSPINVGADGGGRQRPGSYRLVGSFLLWAGYPLNSVIYEPAGGLAARPIGP
jgi:hypothetical protein